MKYKIEKLSTCRATLFCCKFWVDVSRFHLAWSTCHATKMFCCRLEKCSALIAWCGSKTSCKFDEKQATKPKCVAQSRRTLCFSQQLCSTCNKNICCVTSMSRKWKMGNIDPKLAMKQCCTRSWGFFHLVFCRLKTNLGHLWII